MDETESLAKVVLESAFPGITAQYRKSQADGEHDFDLLSDGGLVGIVEVTRSADQQYLSLQAAIRGKPGRPATLRLIPTHSLSQSWLLYAQIDARITTIKRRAEPYLKAIEQSGLTTFYAESH